MSPVEVIFDGKSSRGQRARGLNGHHRPHHGASVEWFTPPEVFEMLGTRFDLDPCSPPGGLPWVPADRFIDAEEDGLAADWGRSFVFMNPPYGADVVHWMRKMVAHDHGIVLVPARVDTQWWHKTVRTARSQLELEGRLFFMLPDHTRAPHNSGAATTLIAYGQRAHDVLVGAESAGHGMLWRR